MQKLLLMVLAFLVVVFIAEAGIFVWFKTTTLPATKLSSSIEICATPTPFPDAAINPQTLQTLSALHQGTVKSSTVITQHEGKITELEFDTRNYALKFRILGEHNQSNAFIFFNFELSKLQFAKKDSQGKETTMDKKELQIGDTISMSLTTDLTKSLRSNLITGKIVKL